MAATNKEAARQVIAALNLSQFITKALKSGALRRKDVSVAEREYRHFMYLLWMNKHKGNTEFVVPTERADAIWHEHILHTAAYRSFCTALTGEYIDHTPGLEKGTANFNRAVEHTCSVHRASGKEGFMPMYLGVMAGADAAHTSSSRKKETSSAGEAGGGDGVHDMGASCGGASCGGGGGCGGGCGG